VITIRDPEVNTGNATRTVSLRGLGAWPLPARARARGVDGVDRIGEPRIGHAFSPPPTPPCARRAPASCTRRTRTMNAWRVCRA
jgi:hypothetical protein